MSPVYTPPCVPAIDIDLFEARLQIINLRLIRSIKCRYWDVDADTLDDLIQAAKIGLWHAYIKTPFIMDMDDGYWFGIARKKACWELKRLRAQNGRHKQVNGKYVVVGLVFAESEFVIEAEGRDDEEPLDRLTKRSYRAHGHPEAEVTLKVDTELLVKGILEKVPAHRKREVEQIMRGLAEGYQPIEIARAHGWCEAKCSRLMRLIQDTAYDVSHGVQRQADCTARYAKESELEQIRELFAQGYTNRAIAARIGRSSGFVSKWARIMGLTFNHPCTHYATATEIDLINDLTRNKMPPKQIAEQLGRSTAFVVKHLDRVAAFA